MRLLFILFAVFAAASYAWHPRVSPPANQLERLATGTDLYLVCQVSESEVGTDNVELLWFKDGTPMTRQKIRKNGYIQASLAFVKPTKAETGNYTCKASISDETKEETVPVEFFERAGFVESEASIHPEEGENARITCETRGDRLDEIFWLKNGYQLSEADERGYQFEDDYRTLIIPDFFGEKDDGNYSCNVVQFAQIYTKDISVTAYSRPVITVFQVPENNAGFEGSSATFKCSASGKPSPTYKWFKVDDDDSLDELNESDKYKIDDGLLGINYLSESDAGLYTCLAENEVGSSKQNATLVIHRKPKIERMDDVTTVLGNSVELVCSINSDSNITEAYFMFNKQKYSPHSKDTVSYETVTDEIETTTSDNSEEDGEETATVGNSVQESGEEENVDDEEEDVESRKRRNIIDNTINVEWRDEKLVLTIPNAQMSHMGKYACYAKNMAGTTYDAAKILITHAPVFTNVSERYIRRQEGESAFLFCEVSAIPNAEMSFEHGTSRVYPDGVNVQLEDTNDKLALSFNSLQDSDFGTYRCTAKNSQGTAEPAVFEIIKIVPPKDPEAIACADNVYPNYAICRLDGYDDQKRGEWPTRFQVYYTTEEPTDEFDWENSATAAEASFVDGKTLKITGLNTEQKYFARIRGINEAGEGELSDVIPFETTAAWTPEPVSDAVIDCPDVCSVNWTTPNDRGAEITGYKLVFRETSAVVTESEEVTTTEIVETVEVTTDDNGDTSSEEENTTIDDSTEDDDEEDDVREQITINVGANDRHVDLPQLLPLRNYELTIYSINAVGLSDPKTYYFRTTEKSGLATLFPLPNWAVITLFIVVGLVLAIMLDAFCCKTRHCGVLACLTSHCRNRRNRAPKDIEQGTASAEHRVLITTTEKQIIRNDH